MALKRQSVLLGVLLAPVTLFLGVFFLLPLCIIALFSFLTPGLYGGGFGAAASVGAFASLMERRTRP